MDCVSVCITVQQLKKKLVTIHNKSNQTSTLTIPSDNAALRLLLYSSAIVHILQSFPHQLLSQQKHFSTAKSCLSGSFTSFDVSCYLRANISQESLYGSSFNIKSVGLLTSIYEFLTSIPHHFHPLSLSSFHHFYHLLCFIALGAVSQNSPIHLSLLIHLSRY